MNRRSNVLSSFIAMFGALLIGVSAVASPVFAATKSTSVQSKPPTGAGNGIKISPVHSDLTISPGSSATVDVYVTNVTGQAAAFQVLANDFVASGDESGNPAVLLNPKDSAPSHGLKQFIAPIGNITLNPQETKDVKVVVTMPANVAPGGYYGAVRVAPATDTALTGGKNIALSASVASLILVKVPGDIKEQVSIASFDARSGNRPRSIFIHNNDITAVVRFQNEGNLQEQPFGKIVVKNISGHVVGSYEINTGEPRGNVLPDSVRRFDVKLKNISSFGRYTMSGNFGYANGQSLSATATFYVIPVPLIIFLVILAVAIIVGIFEIPRMIKAYNRRVIKKAGRG